MLGVITEVTFSITRSFLLREVLTRHSLEECLSGFNSFVEGVEHVKLWIELFSETCAVFTANSTTEKEPRENPNWTPKNIEVSFTASIQ